MSKLYTYRIFNNTACAERRPSTEDDLEDYYDDEIECDNDYEALQAIYEELFPYKDDSDEFDAAQDFVEFFEEQDIGDGSPFPIYIRQGKRTLYDLDISIEELLGLDEYDDDDDEYDDDEYDDEYED